MNTIETMEFFNKITPSKMKLGLERLEQLLFLLDDPQKDLRYIHVAGTNAKGSTIAFLSQILKEAGLKVGMFTSPFLEEFEEQIQVNHTNISKDQLATVTTRVKACYDKMAYKNMELPTAFEVLFAVAILYFKEQDCDIVIVEVGLGGRFDATNVIPMPLLAIITTISYDHMNILGKTLAEIAYQKAGIIKENGEVLVYPQEEEVTKVLHKVCSQKNAKIHMVQMSKSEPESFDYDGQTFYHPMIGERNISLLGRHQLLNASTAITAAFLLREAGFIISQEALKNGLLHTRWPARFEILSKNPLFIVDGAHNLQGMQCLYDNLRYYFSDKKIICIMGVLADKEYEKMLAIIVPIAKKFYTVTPFSERALKAHELAKSIKAYGKMAIPCESMEEAVKLALEEAGDEELICAFGSLYYVGFLRKILNK